MGIEPKDIVELIEQVRDDVDALYTWRNRFDVNEDSAPNWAFAAGYGAALDELRERLSVPFGRERFKHHFQQFFKCSDEDGDEAEESANLLIADGISPIDAWSTIYVERGRRMSQMMNTIPIHALTRSMYREQE